MDTYKLSVNNDTAFLLSAADTDTLDTVQIESGNTLHVIHNDKTYLAEILSVDLQKELVVLKLNGETYTVQIADQYDQLINKMGLNKTAKNKVNEIKAPMPGLVIDIMVTAGQQVEPGQPLLILEAMKMENIIKAPGIGIIKYIAVEKQKPVDKGTLLIELE